VDLESFVSSLLDLAPRQWRVILALLVCANLLVYGTVGWLWWAYVYSQPAPPDPLAGPASTPTLRPTYTPTWTPTVQDTRAATRTPIP
jgi:hypothetical protein